MKEKLIAILNKTLTNLRKNYVLPEAAISDVIVTPCKESRFGDYATNCALLLSKNANIPSRELAQIIVDALPETKFIRKIEIAGPGFINFFLQDEILYDVIEMALDQGDKFGLSNVGNKQKIHLEYVSANPTGPLHVGHGRGAAFGACVANLLRAIGYKVHCEYYVNDIGRQMQILTLSVWIRYLQLQSEEVNLPQKAYQGQYVVDIAKQLEEKFSGRFHHTAETFERLLPTNISENDDPESYMDVLVGIAKETLGLENFNIIFQVALKSILDDIREDLSEFGVVYDEWFHESSLFEKKLFHSSIKLLDDQGFTYEKDGAKWFRATQFGDEKDRVLVRSNGVTTYFASDVAYHLYKYNQGYDQIIDVFGADHHGYVARIRAFLQGLKKDPDKVRILMVQFAILYRGKEKVSMSTRGGQFVTLRELRAEVGNDAARFFYIMRKPEQHLDFDLELAKSESSENPVYYIQYAYARICSVWRQMEADKIEWNKNSGIKNFSLLNTQHEKDLMSALMHYPDLIVSAGQNHEPHLLAYFLLNLANTFHTYYNSEKFLVENVELRNARLCLVKAVQHVLANGLKLLGISAPEKM